jgi:hypothetical protein
LLQVDGRPVVELRVPIQNAGKANAARAAAGGERTEVWIGEQAASGLRRLHGEVVGPRDADGETRTEATVSSEGIFQFQTAARLVRCSGAPMRLGLRRYDFGRGSFRRQRRPAATGAHGPRRRSRGNRSNPRPAPRAISLRPDIGARGRR